MTGQAADNLKQLPLRALLAYAARCARRVQAVYTIDPSHPEAEECAIAIGAAIGLTEAFASGMDLDPELVSQAEEAAIRALIVARETDAPEEAAYAANAAYAAINAASAALQVATSPQPGAAAGAVLDAVTIVTGAAIVADESVERAARMDWETLHRLQLGRFPEMGEPVDPSAGGLLGPLFRRRRERDPDQKESSSRAREVLGKTASTVPQEKRKPARVEKPAPPAEESASQTRAAQAAAPRELPAKSSDTEAFERERRQALDELRSARDALAAFEQQLRAKQQTLEQQAAAFIEQQAAMARERAQIEGDRDALRQEQGRCESDRESARKAREQIAELQQQLHQQEAALRQQSEEARTLQTRLAAEQQELERQREQLALAETRLRENGEELRTREAELLARREDLQRREDSLRDEQMRFSASTAASVGAGADAAAVQQAAELQAASERLRDERQWLDEERNKLKAEQQEVRAQELRLRDGERELALTGQRLAEQQEQLARAAAEREDAGRQLEQERQRLESARRDLEAERLELAAQRESLESEQTRIRQESRELQTARSEVQTERQRLSASAAQLETQRKAWEAERARAALRPPALEASARKDAEELAELSGFLGSHAPPRRPESAIPRSELAERSPRTRRNDATPLRILLQPGAAGPQELAALLGQLEHVYSTLSGWGLRFRTTECRLARAVEGTQPLVEILVHPTALPGTTPPAFSVLQWAQFRSCLFMSLRLDQHLDAGYATGAPGPQTSGALTTVVRATELIRERAHRGPKHSPSAGPLPIDSLNQQLQGLDEVARGLAGQFGVALELSSAVEDSEPESEPPPPSRPEPKAEGMPVRPARRLRRRLTIAGVAVALLIGAAGYRQPLLTLAGKALTPVSQGALGEWYRDLLD